MATRLKPEIWKAFVSFSYFVTVTIITSLVMVIVHDRVPDMKVFLNRYLKKRHSIHLYLLFSI